MSVEPLPGHLSKAEIEELIGPVRHFRAFVSDALTLQFGRDLLTFDEEDASYRIFNFSSGNLLYGNTDLRVALVHLRSGELPHFIIQPSTLLHRIRGIFNRRRIRLADSSTFDRQYLVFGEDKGAIQDVLGDALLTHLVMARSDLLLEANGPWLVAHRRGMLEEGAHQALLAEVRPLVRLLLEQYRRSAPGRR